MTARWFRLLKRYPNQRGPTVPFLLGALRQPPGARITDLQTCQAELRALLTEIRDGTPDDHQVTISRCGNLLQPIVALEYRHPGSSGVVRLESPTSPNRALWCEPIYGAQIHDIDSLVAALWHLHGGEITDARFSWDKDAKEWRAFTEPELERISQALAEDEEGEA